MGLALLSGLSWWAARQSEPRATAPGAASEGPDYWVEGLRAVAMSPRGAPERRLVADEMRHYPGDDTSELDQPRLAVQPEGGVAWGARAERGRVGPDGAWVLLEGAVRVRREAEGDLDPIELHTERLRVQPKLAYVETDEPVQILKGSSRMDAVGLQAWVEGPPRIKLLAEVRGRYVQD